MGGWLKDGVGGEGMVEGGKVRKADRGRGGAGDRGGGEEGVVFVMVPGTWH